MAYDSNKAALSTEPDTSEGPSDKPSLGPLQSNQERATGDGARTVAVTTSDVDGVGYTSTQRKLGNQVMVGPNTKGTGTLKDPLNSYASTFYPAASNPSGQDLAGNRKAAGRNTGKPSL